MKSIGITIGDPAGIGPEIAVKALSGWRQDGIKPVILGDAEITLEALGKWGRGCKVEASASGAEISIGSVRASLVDVPTQQARGLPAGVLHPANGIAMLEYTRRGVELVKEGAIFGLIGGPHNKEAVAKAGIKFQGYPNFVADLAGVESAFIMLAAGDLRCVGVTLHVPLKEACRMLDFDLVKRCVLATNEALKRLGIASPRIAVAGVNPHAGEGGAMGTEEVEFVIPALNELRKEGIDVHGPFAADSMYAPLHRSKYDGHVGMYHDQAYTAVKTLHFGRVVSLVIGIPFLFGTVGHGSAYDIAGKGIADPASLLETVDMISMVEGRGRARQT